MPGVIATTQTFADGDQVTSAKLNNLISLSSFTDDAVTGTTLTVTGGKLKVGTITSAEIGANAILTVGIADNAVTTVKIADGNITSVKLANLAVTAAKIMDGSITAAKLSGNVVPTEAVMEAETAGYLVTPDFVKHSLRVAKAHGVVELTAGRDMMVNKLNVASASAITTTTTRIQFTTDMGATNYTVLASWESTTADAQMVGVYNKAAGGFYLKHPVAAADKFINFVVFGPY